MLLFTPKLIRGYFTVAVELKGWWLEVGWHPLGGAKAEAKHRRIKRTTVWWNVVLAWLAQSIKTHNFRVTASALHCVSVWYEACLWVFHKDFILPHACKTLTELFCLALRSSFPCWRLPLLSSSLLLLPSFWASAHHWNRGSDYSRLQVCHSSHLGLAPETIQPHLCCLQPRKGHIPPPPPSLSSVSSWLLIAVIWKLFWALVWGLWDDL